VNLTSLIVLIIAKTIIPGTKYAQPSESGGIKPYELAISSTRLPAPYIVKAPKTVFIVRFPPNKVQVHTDYTIYFGKSQVKNQNNLGKIVRFKGLKREFYK